MQIFNSTIRENRAKSFDSPGVGFLHLTCHACGSIQARHVRYSCTHNMYSMHLGSHGVHAVNGSMIMCVSSVAIHFVHGCPEVYPAIHAAIVCKSQARACM